MPAKPAEDIAAAEAAYKIAQAAHQAALDSDYPDGEPGFGRWVERVEETADGLAAARFALLAAYGMPDAAVNAARAAYAAKR